MQGSRHYVQYRLDKAVLVETDVHSLGSLIQQLLDLQRSDSQSALAVHASASAYYYTHTQPVSQPQVAVVQKQKVFYQQSLQDCV